VSTPTTASAATGAAEPAQTREQRIDQIATTEYTRLKKAEARKPPEQRITTDKALWEQARKLAVPQARREAVTGAVKKTAKDAALAVYADGKAACARNRRQLAPWLLTVPYAMTGEAAYLLAEYGSGTHIGVSAVTAATAAAGSWIAWRRKIGTATPAPFAERMKTAIGMLCGWTAAMPLVPAGGQAGMWLALTAGAAWMGLPWWRRHDHPIPLARDVAALNLSTGHTPAERNTDDEKTQMIDGVLQAWADRVAVAAGAVPESQIRHDGETDNAVCFPIQLAPGGRITADNLDGLKGRIALAIGVFARQITFDGGERVDQVTMRIAFTNLDTVYNGPVVLCDGRPISSRWEITPGSNVDIVLGGHLDGEGVTSYRVVDAGSVNSAFILGSLGSGKTLLAEQIGIALKFIGVVLWYVDGQDGASSEVLKAHADWAIPLTPKAVDDLYQAIKGAAEGRNLELKVRPELNNKYTFDPARPPIITMCEEAQGVFEMTNKDGDTYGVLFGQLARKIRKNGLGFVAISQDLDLASTFGGSDILRGCLMAAGNFFAMRFVSMARKGMLPATCPDLGAVPKHGFGYSPYGPRPDAMWRAANIENSPRTKDEWMGLFDLHTLDTLTRRSAGQAYRNRHQAMEVDLTAARARYELLANGSDADVEAALAKKRAAAQQAKAAEPTATIVRFPFGTATPAAPDTPIAPPAAPGPAAAASAAEAEAETLLTGKEREVLEIVRDTPQTPTTLAAKLGITPQGAGKHLASLVAKRVAVKMEDGRHMAR
jgi:DNA-binding CsgD family transcriptional regulator